MPQWPVVVYWHKHTSATTNRFGTAARIALIACCTGWDISHAEEPCSSLYVGIPKISTPRIPRSYTSCAIFTASSTDKWYWPGNVSISFLIPSPGTINNG